MYSFVSRVRYSELNHEKNFLDCSSIINYFQDCSTFHTEDRGLAPHLENRVWLLNGWQLEIQRPARLGDYITVGTWAYEFKGFYGYRNYIMKDAKDAVLAVANSIWVYIDKETGKPARIPKDYAVTSGYGAKPPYPMSYGERKVSVPEEYAEYPDFAVIRSNIDSNNHVNNGQYIKMAEEYLPKNFYVESMRVEYRAQALFGDRIHPLVSQEDNTYTVVLADKSKKPYAILEFTGRHSESNQKGI